MIDRLLRRALLWAARNPWLGERLPTLPFMQKAVHRFMPGEEIEDALGAAVDLQVLGIGTLYTKLGEAIADQAGAQAVADHYLALLAKLQAAGITGELSVKPTQLGLDVDEDVCLRHLRTLAEAARAQGSFIWIDMEDSSYVDRTLDLYQRLRATHPNSGICLQAYLRRTARDVERLLPIAPAVRLVKGAYDEPRSVAFKSKKEVDANFLGLSVTMLRESRNRPGMRVGLGTHDVGLIEQIAVHAAAAGVPKDGFEVQMLYGIRAREQRRLARSGYRVQTLIAYGAAWYRWYMRRLAERPANVVFAVRQMLPW
ncbi:MAG TPA: proline dehydrogenase family protein [Candidatus Limnocylindrales bacterium]|nr:proline dehydrogenase family protein [Candidatus Limnocylindrales bacterium]